MKDDMAARLREWSVEAQLPETRESTVRMRAVNGLAIAADEIERLRAQLVSSADELAATLRELRRVEDERDEARRQLCNYKYRDIIESYPDALVAPQTIATARGWDCFKENKR